ncbi:MAG: DUF1214 domain-containing protein, partial [Rhodopila sp.]
MVIDLPPGPYIGLVDDHYQGWVLDMGIPGPHAGKGGKYLLLPPGYHSAILTNDHAGRSLSNKGLVAVRALPVGGNVAQAMNALRAIRVYPLADAAHPPPFTAVDTTQMKMDSTSLAWEDNIQFWEKLHDIINAEPIVEKFLPMYGLLQMLGIEKGKPFAPDARMKAILEKAARVGRDQLLVSAFASDRPDRLAWSDRKWEWAGLVPGSAQFETPAGIDLEARDRWFAQAIVTSPAMFRRNAGAGSLYWLGTQDASGAYLDGGKTYKLVIPQPVPDKLFWSVTAYDAVAAGHTGLPWPDIHDAGVVSLLQTLRKAAGRPSTGRPSIAVVLPIPGDVRGLPPGTQFGRDAIAAGEAVIVTHPEDASKAVGLVPEFEYDDADDELVVTEPAALSWTVYSLASAPVIDQIELGEAEYDLRLAVRSAADTLTTIGLGSTGVDVDDPRGMVEQLLDSTRQHQVPEPAPSRALRVLENAA